MAIWKFGCFVTRDFRLTNIPYGVIIMVVIAVVVIVIIIIILIMPFSSVCLFPTPHSLPLRIHFAARLQHSNRIFIFVVVDEHFEAEEQRVLEEAIEVDEALGVEKKRFRVCGDEAIDGDSTKKSGRRAGWRRGRKFVGGLEM